MKTPVWTMTLLMLALWVPQPLSAGKALSNQINWISYDEAEAKGAGDRKYFLYFYTDQCPACTRLKKYTFTDKAVIEYINTNYTPVKVNVGKDPKLATRFRIQAVPDLRFLSPNGKDIARWPGYIESQHLLTLLQYIGTNSYEEISFKDFVKRQNNP